MKELTYTCAHCGETYESEWSDDEAMEEYRTNGFPADAESTLICDDCYQPFMAWARKLGLATTAALALCFAAPASAHCPAGCEPVGPTPAPTVVPSATPKPTAASEKCPPGTPLYPTTFSRIIPPGAKLIYCTRLNLATPPSRLVWAYYDKSDQDCGNLKMTVRQLSGAKQVKSSGPMANGSVQFTKRVGQGEDPARVANGDYIVTVEGFPTHCTDYLLTFGVQP